MKFTVTDRLVLLNAGVLPDVANRFLGGLVMEFRKHVALTPADLKAIKFDEAKTPPYDADKANARIIDIPVSYHLQESIWKQLSELEKNEKLPLAAIPLYDKFEGLQKRAKKTA